VGRRVLRLWNASGLRHFRRSEYAGKGIKIFTDTRLSKKQSDKIELISCVVMSAVDGGNLYMNARTGCDFAMDCREEYPAEGCGKKKKGKKKKKKKKKKTGGFRNRDGSNPPKKRAHLIRKIPTGSSQDAHNNIVATFLWGQPLAEIAAASISIRFSNNQRVNRGRRRHASPTITGTNEIRRSRLEALKEIIGKFMGTIGSHRPCGFKYASNEEEGT